MAPIPAIVAQINTLTKTLPADQFMATFGDIIDAILAAYPATPREAADTAVFLNSYLVSESFDRNNRYDRCQLIRVMLADLVNSNQLSQQVATPGVVNSRRDTMRLLAALFYNIPSILVDYYSDQGTYEHDCLPLLEAAVGSVLGPVNAVLQVELDRLSGAARVVEDNGQHVLQVGHPRNPLPVTTAPIETISWNMQGASDKWSTSVAGLLNRIKGLHWMALQECGRPPGTAVKNWVITDQFGNQVSVGLYRWRWASSRFTLAIYYMSVQESLQDRLSYAVCINESLDEHDRLYPVNGDNGRPIVISTSITERRRLALGVRVRRGSASNQDTEPFTIFSYHAFTSGGANAPWTLREVNIHVPGPWYMLADFNREPQEGQPPEPWVPVSMARLVAPATPTYPRSNPRSSLDYLATSPAEASGTAVDVLDPQASDHCAAYFITRNIDQ